MRLQRRFPWWSPLQMLRSPIFYDKLTVGRSPHFLQSSGMLSIETIENRWSDDTLPKSLARSGLAPTRLSDPTYPR